MSTSEPNKVYQLRVYEVDNDKREVFHRRFRDHALRIMAHYGFKIVGLWESTSARDFEFIYLLEWPDSETMERQWQAFLADAEWNEIKEASRREAGGEPVLSATGRVLETLPYGPAFHIA